MPGTTILAPERADVCLPPTARPVTVAAIRLLRVSVTRDAVTAPWKSDSDAIVARTLDGPEAVQPCSLSLASDPVTIAPPDR